MRVVRWVLAVTMLLAAGCAETDSPGTAPSDDEGDGNGRVVDWDLSGRPPQLADLGLEPEGRNLRIRDPQRVHLTLPDGRELVADDDALERVWLSHSDGAVRLVAVDWFAEDPQAVHALGVELAQKWAGDTDDLDEWLERMQAGEEGDFEGVSNNPRDQEPGYSVVLHSHGSRDLPPKVEWMAVWPSAGGADGGP